MVSCKFALKKRPSVLYCMATWQPHIFSFLGSPTPLRFSLLVAALGHDIGHPGVNNGRWTVMATNGDRIPATVVFFMMIISWNFALFLP